MSKYKGRNRLSLNITAVQSQKLRQLIPWGLKNKLFGAIIDDMIKVLESEHKDIFIGGMITRDIKLSDFNKEARKAVENVED